MTHIIYLFSPSNPHPMTLLNFFARCLTTAHNVPPGPTASAPPQEQQSGNGADKHFVKLE